MYELYEAQGKNDSFDRIWQLKASAFQKRKKKGSEYLILVKMKGRPGAVVRAVSLSHQVVGLKQPLRRFVGGRLASVFPFPRPHSCGSLRHWVCPFFLSYH